MALRSPLSRVLQRLGCVVSIFLLVVVVLVSPPIVAAAHADNGPAMVTVLGPQTPHTTICHSAPACAAFVAPAETSVTDQMQLQSLRFVIPDAPRLIQSGPSTQSPPPRL